MLQEVSRFLTNPPSYHRCLLLTHPQIDTLVNASTEIRRVFDLPVIGLGGEISNALLGVQPSLRQRELPVQLSRILQSHIHGPIVCNKIDLLFEPSLAQNPLKLFLDNSRLLTLIIMWPGQFENNTLTYAVPEHAHFRTWSSPDLCSYCLVNLS